MTQIKIKGEHMSYTSDPSWVGRRVEREFDGVVYRGTVAKRSVLDDYLCVKIDSWNPDWIDDHKPYFRWFNEDYWVEESPRGASDVMYPLTAEVAA